MKTTSFTTRLVLGCTLALACTQQISNAQIILPPGGGTNNPCTNCPGFVLNTNRNYVKYMNQVFSIIDTNAAATTDTNLYEALLTFQADTNTEPNLQIMRYGTNSLLIRANHFDYTAETSRDFALLICDKVETPVWKAVDFFGASDAQDGWLVQGSVPHWEVTDPMYFLIENYARDCHAFFRAIPYGGPEVTFTNPQPYEVVSNTISIGATVSDLSGTTNHIFEVTVDGLAACYWFETNNTISLNTKYNPEGPVTIYLRTINRALVCDITNAPDNSRIFFSRLISLPLNFENDTYLLFGSDNADPEIGTNYFYFVTDAPQTIAASIFDPSDGHTVATYGGYVPYAATVSLAWDFTDAGGTSPFTNDNYVVNINTTDANSNSTAITITNQIARDGVRQGAGCFLTYQEEDPGDSTGSYWNNKAQMWVKQTLVALYQDQYRQFSLTEYTTSQVGTNRDHAECVALTPITPIWADFMSIKLTNSNYSDLTIGGAHCDGYTVGYSKAYLKNKFTTYDLRDWLAHPHVGKKWRLRKTALWGCFSGADTGDLSFPSACGIRPFQMNTYTKKNAGLFFGGKLPYAWITSGETITTAQAAAFFDQIFVCGKYPVPGACDPTYSISWAIQMTINTYPEMDIHPATGKNKLAQPLGYGFPKLIHTTVYDTELTSLDFSHVKEN